MVDRCRKCHYSMVLVHLLFLPNVKASSPSPTVAVEIVSWWRECWDIMKYDQIPLSLISLSVALLVMVIGLTMNVLVVLFLIKVLKNVETASRSEPPSPSCTCNRNDVSRRTLELDHDDGTLRKVCVDVHNLK